MPTHDGQLGVGLSGIGWCASQHIAAFQRNRLTKVTWLHGRDVARTKANLARYGVDVPHVRITTSYDELLAAPDVDIVSITTPNHLHADQAEAAARAGKHIVLEKPTGLDIGELLRIGAAVRASGVRTIVSFELRYNPFLRFAHWLRTSGWLGTLRFVRVQYLSHVSDWYSGWDWVRTRQAGRSHLLAAGCHAVDALRWCSGQEPTEVSAFHTHFTAGYEWPTSILVNMKLQSGALGHVTSSTDFKMPYAFIVELMGDRATLRYDTIQWLDSSIDGTELVAANPIAEVTLEPAIDAAGRPFIRVRGPMPDSADVSHHPFQQEIDELVTCVLEKRDTSIDVFEAQKTMEVCLAADRSAEERGTPVGLPLVAGGDE